ncbi:MAG: VOC family protein [Vicingaceae bacterium]
MKTDFHVAGIQQFGIGVNDIKQAKIIYVKYFGMDLPVFEDEAEAKLMAQYTGGKIHRRKASLLMNLNGGGGFELWQYSSRKPLKPAFEIKEGMKGITAVHLRCRKIEKCHQTLSMNSVFELSEIREDGIGRKFFNCTDPIRNRFKLIEDDYSFIPQKQIIGGAMGASMGVSDPEKAMGFYADVLGFSELVGHEKKGDWQKWWIKQSDIKPTAFGPLLGPVCLEIIYHPKQAQKAVFENRQWGDLGFIHLCLDVQNMEALKEHALKKGFAFKVDSESSYDMGEASGRFAYLEDPDGSLIELVETDKVPIIKKWNWYLKLNEKSKFRPLPKWIFRILALNRVKSSASKSS